MDINNRNRTVMGTPVHKFSMALEEMDNTDIPIALGLGREKPQIVRQRATFGTIVPILVTLPIERDVVVNLKSSRILSNVLEYF